MKEIKMSFTNDLVLLSHMVYLLILCIGVLLFGNTILDISNYYYTIVVVIIVLPTLYLHLKYQVIDTGKRLLLSDKEMFLISKDGQEINLIEARQVVFHGHVGLTRPNIPFLINPDYYNVFFTMQDGQVFSVSSLLDRKLKNYIYERISKDLISYEYYLLY